MTEEQAVLENPAEVEEVSSEAKQAENAFRDAVRLVVDGSIAWRLSKIKGDRLRMLVDNMIKAERNLAQQLGQIKPKQQ